MRSAPVIGLFEELWRLEIASFYQVAAGKLIEVPTLGAAVSRTVHLDLVQASHGKNISS